MIKKLNFNILLSFLLWCGLRGVAVDTMACGAVGPGSIN